MRSPLTRPALSLVALTTAGALVLGGCSGGDGDGSEGSPSATASATPSSTVDVPDEVELTDPGSDLGFGDSADVVFESTQNRGTVLELTVKGVQRGTLADFEGFILDDAYKKNASYYYAKVTVKNIGEGDVGGVPVPLWGVNQANTLLPAVNFRTDFKKCPSQPLPAAFAPGSSLDTCLVYLSPNKGQLRGISYRPTQQFNPITWTGTITDPPKPKKPTKKPKPKNQDGG